MSLTLKVSPALMARADDTISTRRLIALLIRCTPFTSHHHMGHAHAPSGATEWDIGPDQSTSQVPMKMTSELRSTMIIISYGRKAIIMVFGQVHRSMVLVRSQVVVLDPSRTSRSSAMDRSAMFLGSCVGSVMGRETRFGLVSPDCMERGVQGSFPVMGLLLPVYPAIKRLHNMFNPLRLVMKYNYMARKGHLLPFLAALALELALAWAFLWRSFCWLPLVNAFKPCGIFALQHDPPRSADRTRR